MQNEPIELPKGNIPKDWADKVIKAAEEVKEAEGRDTWEAGLIKLMLELPVNDYRIFHEDLLTNERRPTLRAMHIVNYINTQISLAEKRGAERVIEAIPTKFSDTGWTSDTVFLKEWCEQKLTDIQETLKSKFLN